MKRLVITARRRIEMGLRAADSPMVRQVKVWSRHSGDKVDIAGVLMGVLRRLHQALPPRRELRALSVGSSSEPQFRILEAACRDGLYLLDIEKAALDVIIDRIERQGSFHAKPIQGDYAALLGSPRAAANFRRDHLNDRPVHLVTLHHSLYYTTRQQWTPILQAIVNELLDRGRGSRGRGRGAHAGAIHAVLMASKSDDIATTTWLYNHFAGKFFGAHNDQDLKSFARELNRTGAMPGTEISCRDSRVYFFTEDFEQFMGVVWMILLHPNVHRFSFDQQREVTEFVYEKLWSKRAPLTQVQDHLVIMNGSAAR